jgi:hypothetical protein
MELDRSPASLCGGWVVVGIGGFPQVISMPGTDSEGFSLNLQFASLVGRWLDLLEGYKRAAPAL